MTAQPCRPIRQSKPRPVRKAKADELPVAVYDENGKLVGIVMDPTKIKPLANSETEPDLTPAPAAEVGTPADGDLTKRLAKLKKSVYSAPDVVEQVEAAETLNRAAAVALDIIHGRRRPRGAA